MGRRPGRAGADAALPLLEHEHRPALKRVGLRLSLVNHELRHTAAATWLSLGLPMEYVRRQMGHRQITTTINSYGHLDVLIATDERRFPRVLEILEEAAPRLQLLILTCHPSRYSGLAGAHTVDLERSLHARVQAEPSPTVA